MVWALKFEKLLPVPGCQWWARSVGGNYPTLPSLFFFSPVKEMGLTHFSLLQRITEDQIKWLELLLDHINSSYSSLMYFTCVKHCAQHFMGIFLIKLPQSATRQILLLPLPPYCKHGNWGSVTRSHDFQVFGSWFETSFIYTWCQSPPYLRCSVKGILSLLPSQQSLVSLPLTKPLGCAMPCQTVCTSYKKRILK